MATLAAYPAMMRRVVIGVMFRVYRKLESGDLGARRLDLRAHTSELFGWPQTLIGTGISR